MSRDHDELFDYFPGTEAVMPLLKQCQAGNREGYR